MNQPRTFLSIPLILTGTETHTRTGSHTNTTQGIGLRLVNKEVSRLGWQKSWPTIAGHAPLTHPEGNNRLDNKHRPGSVGHDLAGVQALRSRLMKMAGHLVELELLCTILGDFTNFVSGDLSFLYIIGTVFGQDSRGIAIHR